MTAAIQVLLIYVLPFLVLLTVIVVVHELGHFLVARAFGVAVDRFSIGFGRALVSRTDKHGVEWRVGWLPLGGYVRFSGDSNDASLPDADELEDLRNQVIETYGAGAEKRFYHFKPLWQRALIAVAGPTANFILAVVIFTATLAAFGDNRMLPRVGKVVEGSPAAAAGFLPGDLIKTGNGKRIESFDELTRMVRFSSGDPIRFEVDRGGQTVILNATPQRAEIEDKDTKTVSNLGQLGLFNSGKREDFQHIDYTLPQAFVAGVERVADVIGGTLEYIGRIFTGRESGRELGGMIGMAQTTGSMIKATTAHHQTVAETSLNILVNMAWLCGFISVGIGFVNLLPIPMLDGGHLAFYAYEAVARRPLAAKIQAASYPVGLALVVALMLFATWNDLQRQRAFHFLGGLFS